MSDIIGVHVGKSLDELIHNIFNQLRLKTIWGLLKDLEEVVFDVLEDEVDDSLSPEGVSEFDYVGILHVFEYLDFSHGDFADKFIVLGLLELFDGESLLGLVGFTLEHHPIGPLADDRKYFIFLHIECINLISNKLF